MAAEDRWCKCAHADKERCAELLARGERTAEARRMRRERSPGRGLTIYGHERDGMRVRDDSSSFSLRKSGNTEKDKQGALEAHFAAGRFVPLLKRMRTAAGPACADGDGIDAVSERDVGVGGGALDARLIADEFIGGAQRGKKGRIGGQFPAGAAAEEFHFPFEFSFGALAGRFHLIAHAGGDALAQSGLELGELVLALGANVDLEFGFVGDGVDGSARGGGDFDVDEADRGAHEGVDGIGHAEVGPTVAAGTVDGGFEAAGGQRFGGDVVGAGAIKDNYGFQLRLVGFDEGAHAAEIAFTFFANVGDEKDGAARLDMGFLASAGYGDERGETRAVIGDSGGEEAITVVADFYFGGGGKDGVEMGGEHDHFFFVCAAQLADHVAGLVDLHFEAGRGEKKLHGGSPLRFLKWGRGNFGQARLLLVYPGEIAGKPGQRGAHFGIVGELRARNRTVAMRNTGGPDGHGEEDNPKGSVFHRGVPHVGRDQLRAASAQRACTSDSVRTRADCLAASKMRPTRASSAGMPWRSSQKSTLDLPLIGPISMIWSRPKRCEGTPL